MAPNKACSGLAGFVAIYKHFSGVGLFLFPSRVRWSARSSQRIERLIVSFMSCPTPLRFGDNIWVERGW